MAPGVPNGWPYDAMPVLSLSPCLEVGHQGRIVQFRLGNWAKPLSKVTSSSPAARAKAARYASLQRFGKKVDRRVNARQWISISLGS